MNQHGGRDDFGFVVAALITGFGADARQIDRTRLAVMRRSDDPITAVWTSTRV